MRIAYVAGFFKHVLPELQKGLQSELDCGAVVWIPPFGKTDELNLNRLRGDLLSAVSKGANELLICIFYMRGKEHLLDSVNGIIDRAKVQVPDLEVKIKSFLSARDAAGVISEIAAFGPDNNSIPPKSLASLGQWVSSNHSGKIVLHPRAENSAKNSPYEEISLVYAAVDVLGNEYWDMRTSSPEYANRHREVCEEKLRKLGLRSSLAISDSRAGEQREEYFVTYPVGTEKKRLLECHFAKGNDRDQRYCLRIYFFWDEENKTVVIGWLTSHLGTRAS